MSFYQENKVVCVSVGWDIPGEVGAASRVCDITMAVMNGVVMKVNVKVLEKGAHLQYTWELEF